MNAANKLVDLDQYSVIISGVDEAEGHRWMKVQLALADKYTQYLMNLARQGKLHMPFGPLKALLAQKGLSVKMTELFNFESRTFLEDVTQDLDLGLSTKSLVRRGFDSDGKVISYKGAALWPASILSTSDEDSAEITAHRKHVTTILDENYSRAFTKYLDLAFRNESKSVAYSLLSERERKALMEGNDSGGGFMVPADHMGTMLSRVAAKSIVRRGARVFPTLRDQLTIPAFAANGSVYSSGFTGTWVPEVPLWTETDPNIEAFTISVKKQRIGAKLSRDLVRDVGGVEWLTSNGADNLAAGEDAVFLNGSGANGQPEGILNGGITAIDVEGSTANTISNTTGADGSGSKMLTLAGSLPAQYQRDAVLVTASATEASVNKLVDASRRFLFPRRRGPDGRRELIGYPVEDSPHIPLEGTDANKVVLIGDLNGYVVAQRGLVSMVLMEKFVDSDQVGVVLIDRIGGGVFNPDAFRAGVV